MKKNLLLLIVLIAGMNSCKKVQDIFTFGYNIKGEFSLPPNSMVGVPFNLPVFPVHYNTNQEFSNQGVTSDDVKEIRLSYAKLHIKNPASGTFGFLESIKIYLSKDGVPEKLVAWKENIPDTTGSNLDLDVTPDVLDAYLKSDDFKMRITTQNDNVTTQSYDIEYDIRTLVKANFYKE